MEDSKNGEQLVDTRSKSESGSMAEESGVSENVEQGRDENSVWFQGEPEGDGGNRTNDERSGGSIWANREEGIISSFENSEEARQAVAEPYEMRGDVRRGGTMDNLSKAQRTILTRMLDRGVPEAEAMKAAKEFSAVENAVRQAATDRMMRPFQAPDGKTYHWERGGLNLADLSNLYSDLENSPDK